MEIRQTSTNIRIENVTKKFGDVIAVDNFTLEVPVGKLITLLGPSGCGKTTTLRMVAGLEYPTTGCICAGGEDITNKPPYERDMTMMFQSYALFPHMNVFGNVAYGLKVSKKYKKPEIRKKVELALERVELSGLEKRRTDQLSGGQQQRVALARSIVVEPKVLLFDEPLSNLDAKLRKGTREQVRGLQQELGITSLYVTHDQAEAMSISDEIVVMDAGCLQQQGSAEEIYVRPANQFVANFIGEVNFLPGKVIRADENKLIVQLYDKELELPQQDPPFSVGEKVDLVIRPEAVDFVEVGKGDITAHIRFSHYTGSIVLYSLRLSRGEEMMVQVTNPQERGFLDMDSEVGLRFHRRSLYLLKIEN
jgi:iron(III) transport system ATP-binding protein